MNLQKNDSLILIIICSFLFFYFIGKYFFIQVYVINWDEFYFLSHIHAWVNGAYVSPLQRAHVLLFSWVVQQGGNEIDQIIIARHVMFFMQLGTGVAIFFAARFFFSSLTSLFCCFLYFTCSFVVIQGMSFRADPIVIFLLLCALNLVLYYSHQIAQSIFAGFLIGLAGAITVKSIFIALPIGLIALLLWKHNSKDPQILKNIILMVGVAIFSFVSFVFILISFGSYELVSPFMVHKNLNLFLGKNIADTAEQIFFLLENNLLFFLLFGLSFYLSIKQITKIKWNNKDILKPTILLCLCIPLITLFFYRNIFIYYYVFLLAPISIMCGIGFDYLKQNRTPIIFFTYFILIAVTLASKSFYIIYDRFQHLNLNYQKKFIETVHEVFPEPVPYLDRAFMISSFPNAGFFMSTAVMNTYYNNADKNLDDIIINQEPKFIIGAQALYPDTNRLEDDIFHLPLKKRDQNFITNHYIPHWRELYVIGKNFDIVSDKPKNFDILIEGPYTVESIQQVFIDNNPYNNGEIVYLTQGYHSIYSPNVQENVTLRWGRNIYKPKELQGNQPPLFNYF